MRLQILQLSALALLAGMLSGCLSSSYVIPHSEVKRLAQLPPEERGERVRVLQRLDNTTMPDDDVAPQNRDEHIRLGGVAARSCERRTFVAGSHVATYRPRYPVKHVKTTTVGRGTGSVSPSRSGSGTVRAAAPGTSSSGNGTVRAAAPSRSGKSLAEAAGRPPSPTSAGPDPAHPRARGGSAEADGPTRRVGGSSSGDSGSSDGGDVNVDDPLAAIAVVVVVAAAVTAVAIMTEGMRFDGWASLDPDHPIRFLSSSGITRVVSLRDLRPEDTRLGRAIVLEEDGLVDWLERAPLNRVGFAWRMEGGMVQLPTPDGETPLAGAANIQFGYFPLQSFGILLTALLSGGSHAGGKMVGIIYGLELDFIPLELGPLHLGVYGAGTMGYHAAEGGKLVPTEFHEGGVQTGVIAEFDLTTRLGLLIRGGVQFQYGGNDWLDPMFVTSAGFSVY